MGGGCSGNHEWSPSSRDQLDHNIEALKTRYPTSRNGWFGRPGDRQYVQVINCEPGTSAAVAERFFRDIGTGATRGDLRGGKGYYYQFDDGSRIQFRPVSSRMDSVVEISIHNKKDYKIHFEEKK